MPIPANILSALGLGEDATDEQALEKATALSKAAEKPEQEPEPGKTLDQLAGAQGKVVLDATQYAQLQTDAKAGADAAAELKQSKFDTAWATALDKTAVLPAQKENFQALYEADAEQTLSLLDSLPGGKVNTEAQGHGGPGRVDVDPNAEGDPDMVELDARATALAAEKGIDYADAVILAASELGVAA